MGDESYAAGVVKLAGSPGAPLVDSHLALLQANVRRTAVVTSLHAAESCVRWDALRCSATFSFLQRGVFDPMCAVQVVHQNLQSTRHHARAANFCSFHCSSS